MNDSNNTPSEQDVMAKALANACASKKAWDVRKKQSEDDAIRQNEEDRRLGGKHAVLWAGTAGDTLYDCLVKLNTFYGTNYRPNPDIFWPKNPLDTEIITDIITGGGGDFDWKRGPNGPSKAYLDGFVGELIALYMRVPE